MLADKFPRDRSDKYSVDPDAVDAVDAVDDVDDVDGVRRYGHDRAVR